MENNFQREKIDRTLFIQKVYCSILNAQIYMNDNNFESSNPLLYKKFVDLIKEKKNEPHGKFTLF